MIRKVFLGIALLLHFSNANKSWRLLHSFDSGLSYTERGSIELRLNDSGEVEINVSNLDDALADVEKLNVLNEGLYQVKLIVDGEASNQILASVPACQVRRANFRDEFILTLNSEANVISLSYIPLVSPLAPKCQSLPTLEEIPKFLSKITFETATQGMTIPTILPQTKPPIGLKFFPRSQGAKDIPGYKPEDAGSKGFLMKYWYIILPLVIMSLTSGNEEVPRNPAGSTEGSGESAAARSEKTRAEPVDDKVRRGKRG